MAKMQELKPVFKSTPTQFQTTIYANVEEENVTKDGAKDGAKELTDIQKVILVELQANSSITTTELAQKINIKFRTLQRYISQLQESGFLTRKGGRKDGEWLLTELGLHVLEKNHQKRKIRVLR